MNCKKKCFVIVVFLLVSIGMTRSQTLQVSLSPDKSKVDRNAKEGKATIIFDCNIEDINIVCTDENPDEPIERIADNLWYVHIDAKKDIDSDGVCYRNFLLKSSVSSEYYLTTESITPKQVLYYTVFLPEMAGGIPLKIIESCDAGFNRGDYPEDVMGLLSTLPVNRMGLKRENSTTNVYRNLRNNQYDQSYQITSNGLINNINAGDVLTFLKDTDVFYPVSIMITDSILKSGEVKVLFTRKRTSLCGFVIDEVTRQPVPNCKVKLYLGNSEEKNKDMFGKTSYYYTDFGYKRYYETGDCIGEFLTKNDGYFGWENCVIDYTYYITVSVPRGYTRIKLNEGVNIKPFYTKRDSFIIEIKPRVVKGYITDKKKGIPNVLIECETIYGKKVILTGHDGNFEIVGPTSKYICFKHDNYRTMMIEIDDFIYYEPEESTITIKMKRGKVGKLFKGKYGLDGKIKEIK